MKDDKSELEGVAAVLIDRLHATEDEELQAALWQVMEYADEMDSRRVAALRALVGES